MRHADLALRDRTAEVAQASRWARRLAEARPASRSCSRADRPRHRSHATSRPTAPAPSTPTPAASKDASRPMSFPRTHRAASRRHASPVAPRGRSTPPQSARGCPPRRCGSPVASFYCPKASRAERDAGCEGLPQQRLDLFPNAHGAGYKPPPAAKHASYGQAARAHALARAARHPCGRTPPRPVLRLRLDRLRRRPRGTSLPRNRARRGLRGDRPRSDRPLGRPFGSRERWRVRDADSAAEIHRYDLGARSESDSRGGCPPRLPQNRACAVRTRLFGTAGCEPRRRPVSDLGSFPLQRELGFDGSDDVLVGVAVHRDQPLQPAFGEEADRHGVVGGIGVAQRPQRLVSAIDGTPCR